uniref:Ion transport domain-containing protein n=3 Tax=Physcomitrium patens TaxID=3218 RepID=A0A7I3Z5I5_PHYPA
MLELMAEPPYCVSSHGYHESSCGTAQSAIAYFVLIVYIMSHIITNLFIAQIIDTITFGLLNEDAMLSPKNLTHFQLLWASSEFDPLYECFPQKYIPGFYTIIIE